MRMALTMREDHERNSDLDRRLAIGHDTPHASMQRIFGSRKLRCCIRMRQSARLVSSMRKKKAHDRSCTNSKVEPEKECLQEYAMM
jgi:hypothetical protein